MARVQTLWDHIRGPKELADDIETLAGEYRNVASVQRCVRGPGEAAVEVNLMGGRKLVVEISEVLLDGRSARR